jgi:enamine deaminase RidA (YjgF/YER057c/UK114 family)
MRMTAGDGAHELINPPGLAPASGFAHAVSVAPGRLVFLGGQAGLRADGSLAGATMTEQFDQAAANVAAALAAAGASPSDLVQLMIYVTDVPAYRAALAEIGASYRRHLGRHYPAIALLGVSALFEPGALVELVGVAVAATR